MGIRNGKKRWPVALTAAVAAVMIVSGLISFRIGYSVSNENATVWSEDGSMALISGTGYVLSMQAVSEEDLAGLLENVSDTFTAYTAANWTSGYTTVAGFDYIGSYLLTEKKTASPHNILYVVYQVNVEYLREASTGFINEMVTYYYYGKYQNLRFSGENGGLFADDSALAVPEASFTELDLSYQGYRNLDELYNDLVAVYLDEYICENNVQDADYGYELTGVTADGTVPEDAREYDGHYYKLYSIEGMTWETARTQCELRGGHLVTITSQEEMNFVAIYLISGSRCYWSGGYYDVSAEWKWVTGETMDYTDFVASQSGVSYPYITLCEAGWMVNDNSGGNWGGIMTGGNGYNSSVAGYICEWD